jgi:hypothetical protein
MVLEEENGTVAGSVGGVNLLLVIADLLVCLISPCLQSSFTPRSLLSNVLKAGRAEDRIQNDIPSSIVLVLHSKMLSQTFWCISPVTSTALDCCMLKEVGACLTASSTSF